MSENYFESNMSTLMVIGLVGAALGYFISPWFLYLFGGILFAGLTKYALYGTFEIEIPPIYILTGGLLWPIVLAASIGRISMRFANWLFTGRV